MDQTAPLTIAVLVDTSGSMRLESKLASAREVVAEMSGGLRDGVDDVGLFTFDKALHELQPFTNHPASIAGELRKTAPFGVTSLYDAIAETARRLEARPPGRKAIVVLTDCVDTDSELAPAEVSARASAIDVPVYIVATVPRIDQMFYLERAASPGVRAAADAHDLARWTGGDLLWANGALEAGAAVRTILSELRHQYMIQYMIGVDAAADGTWRRLEVIVRKDRRLNVRARSGYFVGESRPSH
jgi:VWFA-related protein